MFKHLLFVSVVLGLCIAQADPIKSVLGSKGVSIEEDEGEGRNPYVTRGLVAMWDGEWNIGFDEHDSSARVWKDLVGNRDLTLTPSVIFESQCLYRRNGADSNIGGAYLDIPWADWVSVEVVFAEAQLLGASSAKHAIPFDSGYTSRRFCGYRKFKVDGYYNSTMQPGGFGGATMGHASWVPNTVTAIYSGNSSSARCTLAYANGEPNDGTNDGHKHDWTGVFGIGTKGV